MSGEKKRASSFLGDWWKAFRVLLLVYFAAVAFLYATQRSIMYVPATQPLPPPAQMGLPAMEAVTTKTEDGLNLVAWFAPPRDAEKPVVAVFHGNAGSIAGRIHIAEVLLGRGYGVFLAEYRGYGGNPGAPDEEGLYRDGRAAVAWLEEKGYKPKDLAIYGESIGTGVAVQIAAEIQPGYLILQSPFSSAVDVAIERFTIMPARLMVRDRYENGLKIGRIGAPLLIVHGERDTLIRIGLGKKLFEKANEPKTFVTIAGAGHNDMYRNGAGGKIVEWLDTAVGKGAE